MCYFIQTMRYCINTLLTYLQSMTYIAKLQHFHKSIRKQELHSLFQQKRITLIQQSEPQLEQPTHFSQISQGTLLQMAQACQYEEGIERIYNLGIEDKLENFLSNEYLYTKQQDLASSILCNLYMVSRPCSPSRQLTEKLITLLEKGSNSTVSNCVTLIFNIAHDHISWKQNTVKEYNLCNILNRLLDAQNLSQMSLINVLRTIIKVVQKSSVNDSFKCFFPKIIQYLTNCFSDNQIISHAYHCFYHLSLMFPNQSIAYNHQYNLLPLFIKISPLMMEAKFTFITLHLISLTLKSLKEQVVIDCVFPHLVRIMGQGFRGGNKKVKQLVIQIITDSLVESKISSENLMRCQVGQLVLRHFGEQENSQILHYLVYLFSIVIMNIELCPLTHQLQLLFERVQTICPQEIQTIGFIKETIFKARQRAEFY